MRRKKTFNDKPLNISAGKKKVNEEVAKHDKLGLTDYASALAEFISDCETPITVGIQGDWGIGKTSTLNMIKTFLEGQIFRKEQAGFKNGIVWFNTWQYSLFHQDEYLGAAVINALLDSIKTSFNVPDDWMKKGKDTINALMRSLGSVSVGGVSLDPTKALTKQAYDESMGFKDISSVMLNFKTDFENLINRVVEENKLNRIVIFIDDLDRVKPIKALELLESIKNFLDVEHCVFVVAVDYEVVQVGMAQKLGQDIQKSSGKSFFDKIIQLPFNMPTNSYRLDEYVKNLLHDSEFTGTRVISDSEKRYYAEVTACTVGRNPRSIKRVINYAKLLDIIRGKNSTDVVTIKDRQILYALLCMQIAWPEIFSYFVSYPYPETISNLEDWDFLDEIPRVNKLYERTPDVEQLKNNISTFFDLLFDVVDEDGNGTIDREEFKPIWKVLKTVKLTSLEDHSQPFDELLKKINKNDSGEEYSKFMNVLARSKWKSGKEISFKTSGARYFTIVMNRKQVGSIVSLKSNALIFRLKIDDELLIKQFKDVPEKIALSDVFTPLDDSKLTGFGNTLFHTKALAPLTDIQKIKFLNQLFTIILNQLNWKN